MKLIALVLVVLALLTPTFLAAETIDVKINNPRIEGDFFRFEIQIKRTDDWNSGFQKIGGVGNCDFYFDYNRECFTDRPAITDTNSNITDNPEDYELLVRLTGGQLHVKLIYEKVSNVWQPASGVYENLCTIEWEIKNPMENSGVKWDRMNSGFNDGDEDPLISTYLGSADIVQPSILSSFTAVYEDNGVILHWETEKEISNQGFEVVRSEEENSGYEVLSSYQDNSDLESQGNSREKKEYRYIDESIELGTTYWYKIVDVDKNGIKYSHNPVSLTLDAAPIPKNFKLSQNYPNPFNPDTRIEFGVPDKGKRVRIEIAVYDILGQKVKSLINKEYEPGYHFVDWDGRNDENQKLASGVYFLRLQSESFVKTRKMLLVR